MLARALSVLVCVTLLAQSWLAYTVTGLLPGYAGSFYWFTVPHLIILPLASALVLAAMLHQNTRIWFASLLCVCAILPTWLLAALSWSGGDDGPGMAWWYGVGLASLLTTALGLPTVYYVHKKTRRST